MMQWQGIGVSKWQGNINWTAIRETTSISFAIIRVGAGTTKDKYF